MKLIIQIPCRNEEKTLPLVLKDIPTRISGIDIIETQIIDDGCTDNTVQIAKSLGVNHIVGFTGHRGLGNAFKRGIENALDNEADILVNTDGDMQYKSSDIPRLIELIVAGEADIVIGNRQVRKVEHFSWLKKQLQRLGSWVTRRLTGVDILDPVSGFRAYSREALLEINVTSDFSYVIDTIIQAVSKKLRISHIDIEINFPTRESRLFKNMFWYVKRSAATMLSVYEMYNSLRIFISIAFTSFLLGMCPILRFIYFYFRTGSAGHIQSLVLGAMFIIIAVQFAGMALLANSQTKQRKLVEDILRKLKK